MTNRSTFPTSIDTFLEHYDIQASDKTSVLRYQELKLKSNLTTSEQSELADLTILLRNKIFTPEDFNKLQDCITNLETFFKDNTEVYILNKQSEFETFISGKETDITTFVTTKTGELTTSQTEAVSSISSTKDGALAEIETKKLDIINYMDATTEGAIRNDMGVMAELTTTDKSSLVNAINEVKGLVNSSDVDGGTF